MKQASKLTVPVIQIQYNWTCGQWLRSTYFLFNFLTIPRVSIVLNEGFLYHSVTMLNADFAKSSRAHIIHGIQQMHTEFCIYRGTDDKHVKFMSSSPSIAFCLFVTRHRQKQKLLCVCVCVCVYVCMHDCMYVYT